MPRFRSLSVLSALFILAAGLLAVGGSTPEAAAAAAATPSDPYQLSLRRGDGTVDLINVLSWSHEVDMLTGASSGGAATGKRQHKPFVITKELDKSSPVLLQACVKGEHFPQLQLEASRTGKGGREVYLVIKLENIQVTSYQTSGGGGTESAPHEEVAFTFSKITFDYREFGVLFEDDLESEE